MLSCNAQKNKAAATESTVISANGSTGTKDYQLKIKEIISDSRCPEGVNCVWAGEIKLVVSISKGKKLLEETALSITSNQFKENVAWFSKYLPNDKEAIKSIVVLPHPKKGISKDLKDYSILIAYN